MKTIKFALIALILHHSGLLLSAENRYKISGHINPQHNGQKVMLFQFQAEDILKVDTAVIKNGAFTFEGETDEIRFATLTCGNYPNALSAKLLVESGLIHVVLDTISKIGGTKYNDIYNPYLVEYNTIYKKLEVLTTLFENTADEKIETEINDCWIKLIKLERNFVKVNINNPLGLILFKEKYSNWNDATFEEIYAHSDSQLKNDPDIIKYVRWREKRKLREIETMKSQRELAGKKYIDFPFINTEGKIMKLSDYIGKSDYVLLDFWASWCGPCMQEQPKIKEIYEQYKDKGLNVLGISLDSNENAWKNAIKKTGSTWTQLLDQKAGNVIQATYKFNSIPHLILIDRDGIILFSGDMNADHLKPYLLNLYKLK